MKKFGEHTGKVKKHSGVAPAAIHFKQTSTEPSGVAPEPIHFRDVSAKESPKKINEAVKPDGAFNDWLKTRDNQTIGGGSSNQAHNNKIAKKISSTNNFTPDHVKHIVHYTSDAPGSPDSPGKPNSQDINRSLIKGGGKPAAKHSKVVAGLDDAIENNRLQHPLTAYSGVTFNPLDHVDKNGRMKSPAFISATHDKKVAAGYAQKAPGGFSRAPRHIIQLRLNPGDPATHVGAHSPFGGEHETLIARNSTLKHIRTKSYWDDKNENWFHVHEMGIANDE